MPSVAAAPASAADAAAAAASQHELTLSQAGHQRVPRGQKRVQHGEVASYPAAAEAGGLSGPPLLAMSTAVLSDLYRLTGGRVPLIGCGGVSSGEDAYRKLRAGASLVQLYTAFAFEGPALVPRIKRELAGCLARDGFACVAEAVGADHPDIRRAAGAGGAPRRGWLW
ncbi:Dihydroorotate dehydrogenase (quinone), mitochondrial [Tetrabaena socialis]|uniref:Dihydroorotate dehydrogenase (Quinone), mitochondrial n=1 Tax=Tetrabaena socialis TaxID=47790 RepID=A0A2J8AHU4_9CHLO|nr:Dihydroorotate dehydrogenase (quinone), mitochondrial [Tetrabaena socialis]|eukprot:PNH12077.1 Dihydroorotate dehydrogenase (quinone), mitochondrial [Tetrabaena socialis]